MQLWIIPILERFVTRVTILIVIAAATREIKIANHHRLKTCAITLTHSVSESLEECRPRSFRCGPLRSESLCARLGDTAPPEAERNKQERGGQDSSIEHIAKNCSPTGYGPLTTDSFVLPPKIKSYASSNAPRQMLASATLNVGQW
jgi:hypothetical protein